MLAEAMLALAGFWLQVQSCLYISSVTCSQRTIPYAPKGPVYVYRSRLAQFPAARRQSRGWALDL